LKTQMWCTEGYTGNFKIARFSLFRAAQVCTVGHMYRYICAIRYDVSQLKGCAIRLVTQYHTAQRPTCPPPVLG